MAHQYPARRIVHWRRTLCRLDQGLCLSRRRRKLVARTNQPCHTHFINVSVCNYHQCSNLTNKNVMLAGYRKEFNWIDLPPLSGPAFKLEFGAVDRPAGRDGAWRSRGQQGGARWFPVPAGRNPTNCGAGPCCTTRRWNAHGTDCQEVLYPWHPWAGRRVHIDEVIEKAVSEENWLSAGSSSLNVLG